MTKYGAKKVTIEGITFDSKMEGDFYRKLLIEKEEGNVLDIQLQPRFELQPKFTKNGKNIRKIEYIADFYVTYKDGSKVLYDVKGFSKDSTFKLKKKLFDYRYQDIELICITWYGRRWLTIEEKEALIRERKKNMK